MGNISILCLIVNFVVPTFSLLVTKTGGTVVVITPVPVHCLPFIRGSSQRPPVRLLTHSNIEISKTSGPIAIKIYMKDHRGEEKDALGIHIL